MRYVPRVPLKPEHLSPWRFVDEDAFYADYFPEMAETRRIFYSRTWESEIDPVVRETMRIRNARSTDCGVCKQVRIGVALDAGLSESAIDEINDDFRSSSLSDVQKAALILADAFLQAPSAVAEEDRETIRQHFSAAQVVDMLVEMVKYRAFSKLFVTLGIETRDLELTEIRYTPGEIPEEARRAAAG